MEVARKLEQSRGSWWINGSEGKMCTILGACLIQAQDYFVVVERDALEEQLEIDHLKTELLQERERRWLLEKKLKLCWHEQKSPLVLLRFGS